MASSNTEIDIAHPDEVKIGQYEWIDVLTVLYYYFGIVNSFSFVDNVKLIQVDIQKVCTGVYLPDLHCLYMLPFATALHSIKGQHNYFKSSLY